jgi:hypothetical protein
MSMTVDFNTAPLKRVMISYSQESESHSARIRRLADQLRADGIDAIIDQYEPHPSEGWPMWMERQIATSDFVIVVCTETYWKRAEGKETAGRGLGVAWEADLIREALYDEAHRNDRFIPTLFEPDDKQFIIGKLKSSSRYVLDETCLDALSTSNPYALLYRHITGQPLVQKPPLGRPIKLDPINTPALSQSRTSIASSSTVAPAAAEKASVASKGIVLVAEPRADMKPFAEQFTRFVRECGFEVVVPEGYSIERDISPGFLGALNECRLVVQILGPDPFPRSSFLSPLRFEHWIEQQAAAAGKSLLRWRPPALDLNKIVETDYRELLDRNVVKCDAEDFKTVLKDRLTELTAKPRPSGRNLFVHHHTKDTESADEVGEVAQDLSDAIKVALTDERWDVSESIGGDPVHGVMLIYGACGEEWAEKSLDALKKATDAANIRHNLKPPPRAIVKASSDTPPLRRRPPRWKEIEAQDQSALENFVRQVQGDEERR